VSSDLAYLHLPTGHRYCPGYSTGLAAGRGGDAALLRALQEVIERDAAMGAWWSRYPLEEFPAADIFEQLGNPVPGRSVRPNLTYRFLRIGTPFSAHVTMVTLEGEDREGYCFSIGSSCRETRRDSWLKSLLEAIHGRHYVRYLKSQVAAGTMKLGKWPRTFAEHAAWYSLFPEQLGNTILASRIGPQPGATVADCETLERLVDRLGADHPVLFRSMTPPALASQRLGWLVVRVVVPGLQPMHGDHALAHLGGPLWAPRGLLDWRGVPPHPFP
jgi:ribosomal protein S12 methylthiotransferase accessory factor